MSFDTHLAQHFTPRTGLLVLWRNDRFSLKLTHFYLLRHVEQGSMLMHHCYKFWSIKILVCFLEAKLEFLSSDSAGTKEAENRGTNSMP